MLNFLGLALDRAESRLFDFEAEARREPHRSHHPQLVFRKPAFGIADGTNDAGFQIFLPVNEIQHFAGVVPHQQPVNREIASLRVFLRRLRINHAVRVPSVAVTDV